MGQITYRGTMVIPDGVRSRLGDERGFIHKRILGGISKVAGFIPTPLTQFISGAAGALAGGRPTVPRTQTARTTSIALFEKDAGRRVKFGPEPLVTRRGVHLPLGFGGRGGGADGGADGCIWPWRRDPRTGDCSVFIGRTKGPNGAEGGFELGEAVMGKYGSGVRPGSMIIDRAVCGKKMQLGDDGVCYNRSQISNKQRMWPAGRKPLLTGGDMRAISTAARAGKRMDLATKRLQKMGMMKKPVSRRGPTRHQALLEAHVATGSRH